MKLLAMTFTALVVLLIVVLLFGPVLGAFEYTMALAVRTSGCWIVGLAPLCLVILWLIAAHPHRRHWVRYRDRLCVRCGYALAGNITGVCPECGTPIPVPQLVRLRSELARQRERHLESGVSTEPIEHQIRELDRLIACSSAQKSKF